MNRSRLLRGPFVGADYGRQAEVPPTGLTVKTYRASLQGGSSNLTTNSASPVEISPLLRLNVFVPVNGMVKIRGVLNSRSSATDNCYLTSSLNFGTNFSLGNIRNMGGQRWAANTACVGEYTWANLPSGVYTFTLMWNSSGANTLTIDGNQASMTETRHEAYVYYFSA